LVSGCKDLLCQARARMTAATAVHSITFSRTLARCIASLVYRSVKAIFSRATSKTDEGGSANC